MARVGGDSDSIRRQNRGLVLDALRRAGPLARTKLAGETGLSHATITAIATDLVNQGILTDHDQRLTDQKGRGRPAVRLSHQRDIAYSILLELEVNRARGSLIDYSGTLVDRIEAELDPTSFEIERPARFLAAMVRRMCARNPGTEHKLSIVTASVQGIVNRAGNGLTWSPIPGLAGANLGEEILSDTGLELTIYKRGRLLAEGTRILFPDLHDANVATVFIGATIAMGVCYRGPATGRSEDAGTEFGHMVHIPNGALCRCGTHGCIEAYAADYGVLRTAYGVPATTRPAPAVPHTQYVQLIEAARRGDPGAVRAFNVAGSAIGYGLNRLMTVFDPSHIIIVGPGAEAFPLMKDEIESAIAASLVGRVNGVPQILTHGDEQESIFRGLQAKALTQIDQDLFAPLPAQGSRSETA